MSFNLILWGILVLNVALGYLLAWIVVDRLQIDRKVPLYSLKYLSRAALLVVLGGLLSLITTAITIIIIWP